MRSLKARYLYFRGKFPEQYSSYICFAYAIMKQKFTREIISKWFNILVEKDNYVRNERNGIVKYLYRLSNKSEEKEFKAKITLKAFIIS